jgi:chromosome partitioning protein
MFDFFGRGAPRQPKATVAIRRIVDDWSNLTPRSTESDLGGKFVVPMLKELGFGSNDYQSNLSISVPGCPLLKPDYVCFRDGRPVLVIEIKRKSVTLGRTKPEKFVEACKASTLYKNAIGHGGGVGENGICQYLDIGQVAPEYLAPYGLICNGDFFQLWRRVDGLVIPAMPVQQITAKSLPRLIADLKKRLDSPPSALIAALWNRKGGAGKTTNTINIAATLAKQGKSVLLVDFDPQGDLTHCIGFSQPSTMSYFDTVSRKLQLEDYEAAKSILKAEIQCKEFQGTGCAPFELSLLASSRNHLEEFRVGADTLKFDVRFAEIVQLLKSDFDYIFVDAAPALDRLSEALLYAIDVVLTPIDGSSAIRHAAEVDCDLIPGIQEKRLKKNLPYGPLRLGLIKSNWSVQEGSNLESTLNGELNEHGFKGKCYETRLKRYSQAEAASANRVPIACSHNSPAANSFKSATEEIFLKHNFIDR